MSFHEFVDRLKKDLHLDPLEPRTWECNPLLIVAGDNSITYYGPANVEVTPNGDGTADLVTDVMVMGWRPLLLHANVQTYYGRSSNSHGLICSGTDRERATYIWYVNSAALSFGSRILRDIQTGVLKKLPPSTRRPSDEAVG